MRVGSLFSGYGGLDMAVGGDLAWYSEIEPAACRVQEAHNPDVPNIGDITAVDWSQVEPVDVITGGYPCQPFSHAGLRKGKNDERHLWPYVRDAIRAIRPRYAVLENVRGHLTLGFADVLADLASMGWDARWGVVRASDAGAPHGRARLFIVAYPDSQGLQGTNAWLDLAKRRSNTRGHASKSVDGTTADTQSIQQREPAEPDALRAEPRHGSNAGSVQVGIFKSATFTNADIAVSQASNNGRQREARRREPVERGRTDWGQYARAIERWELLTGPAPAPTIRRGERDRLNPVFVEWMMGLPEGHVTGHGLSAAQELKMLGNGVVPQQAALALQLLAGAA